MQKSWVYQQPRQSTLNATFEISAFCAAAHRIEAHQGIHFRIIGTHWAPIGSRGELTEYLPCTGLFLLGLCRLTNKDRPSAGRVPWSGYVVRPINLQALDASA